MITMIRLTEDRRRNLLQLIRGCVDDMGAYVNVCIASNGQFQAFSVVSDEVHSSTFWEDDDGELHDGWRD